MAPQQKSAIAYHLPPCRLQNVCGGPVGFPRPPQCRGSNPAKLQPAGIQAHSRA